VLTEMLHEFSWTACCLGRQRAYQYRTATPAMTNRIAESLLALLPHPNLVLVAGPACTPHYPTHFDHSHTQWHASADSLSPASTHSPQDPAAKEMYAKFVAKIKDVEKEISARNKRPDLKLRSALPYELLAPTSGPGITNRGVPQSISI
jgi:hypothetical protein